MGAVQNRPYIMTNTGHNCLFMLTTAGESIKRIDNISIFIRIIISVKRPYINIAEICTVIAQPVCSSFHQYRLDLETGHCIIRYKNSCTTPRTVSDHVDSVQINIIAGDPDKIFYCAFNIADFQIISTAD